MIEKLLTMLVGWVAERVASFLWDLLRRRASGESFDSPVAV